MAGANGSPIRTTWNGNAETHRQIAAMISGGGRLLASSFTKLIIWQALEAPAVLQEQAQLLAKVPPESCWTLPWLMGDLCGRAEMPSGLSESMLAHNGRTQHSGK